MQQRFYTATHKNKEICQKSSSGGAFTAITDAWFETYKDKAVIYGCVLDQNLKAKHIRAAIPEERNKMRGSKYIESDISGISEQIEKDLKNGMYVAFSGTPCQIAGIKKYINNRDVSWENQLITIEVLCHGVAIEDFFRDYIKHLEHKYKSKAVNCNFRAKTRADALEKMQVHFENGKKYTAGSTKYDWFYSAYLGNYVLKPACYECKFASTDRTADFTIGDNWGDFRNTGSKAGSVVITNSSLAEEFMGILSEKMNLSKTSFNEISKEQLKSPAKKPGDYDIFWNIYNSEGYLKAQKYIGNNCFKGKFKTFLVLMLDRLHLVNVIKKLKRIIKG